jgi:hypothetical protein
MGSDLANRLNSLPDRDMGSDLANGLKSLPDGSIFLQFPDSDISFRTSKPGADAFAQAPSP